MNVIKRNRDQNHQYFEENKTQRNTYEVLFQQRFNDASKLEFKNSLSDFNRKFLGNENFLNAKQDNYFSELSYVKPMDKMIWVLGADFQGNKFTPQCFGQFQIQKFENNSFGLFLQNSLKLEKTTVESGIRSDFTKSHGSFFLPQIAVIHHFNEHWATRGGIGFGYKVPNALAPQVYDFPLESLLQKQLSDKKNRKIGRL